MNITGTIIATNPTKDGGYMGSHGYIYTFDMVIQDANGQQHKGQIGSKSQNYPLNPGQQINVVMTTDSKGVTRFKKFNPKYGAPQQQVPPPTANWPEPEPPYQAQPSSFSTQEAKQWNVEEKLDKIISLLERVVLNLGNNVHEEYTPPDNLQSGDDIPF